MFKSFPIPGTNYTFIVHHHEERRPNEIKFENGNSVLISNSVIDECLMRLTDKLSSIVHTSPTKIPLYQFKPLPFRELYLPSIANEKSIGCTMNGHAYTIFSKEEMELRTSRQIQKPVLQITKGDLQIALEVESMEDGKQFAQKHFESLLIPFLEKVS